jgi:hypothetical protein
MIESVCFYRGWAEDGYDKTDVVYFAQIRNLSPIIFDRINEAGLARALFSVHH